MTNFLDVAQEIETAYSNLRKKEFRDGSSYLAARLGDNTTAYAAVTAGGDFAILLPLAASSSSAFEERLESISVSFNQRYVVDVAGGSTSESSFAAVTLHREHLALLSGFANLAAVLLQALPPELTVNQLLLFLEDFKQLFAARKEVSRDVVKGLWGELWLMDQFSDPSSWVVSWHTNASDIFDFSFPAGRVEVKTTESELRQHHFSLRQLEGSVRSVWIASVQVQAESSGATLASLLSSVSSKVPIDLQPQLARKCMAVVAGDLEAIIDYRFVTSSVEPIRLINSSDVPRVTVPDQSQISSVSFSVILESIVHHPDPMKLLESLAKRVHPDDPS